MNKLFCLLAILVATSTYAATGDITVLSCNDNPDGQSPDTRTLQVIQDSSGAYHYAASQCVFVSHGCAGNGETFCNTSSGEIMKEGKAGLYFVNQGTVISVHNSCAGERMQFDDPTKGLQFEMMFLNCRTQ